MIYADNAATTKMSRTAIEAMLPYMDKVYGNPSSLYSFGQEAKEALESARERIASCLGCEPREITFTSGGSEADNQAIFSAARLGEKKGKKHIISTAFEHHAVLHTLDKLKKQGFEITLLDVHENGIVTAQQVADAIREDTCLVTIMFANNEIGTVQPIAEIGKVCREKGVLFHTDAVQAAGHLYVNVKEQNIDMLSLSAHKFHGPKGIGVLYAKKGIMLDNVINGGAQERGKRAGTENIPAIMGMTAALEEAVANLETIIKNVPDVKIIISSTWRFKGWKWMKELWKKRQLPGKIYSFTPGLEFVRFKNIVHQTFSESVYPYGTRGLEIGEWLRLNKRSNPLVYKYSIIDDDDDFPSEYNDHVILTNPYYGITKETALQVIENLL